MTRRSRITARPPARLAPGLFLLLCIAASARAQQVVNPDVAEREATEIFNTLMSPFCPGRLLANCPSSQAADLRAAVRRQLRAGMSGEAVVDSLYAVYGDQVRGTPAPRGFGLLAWLIPGLAIGAGSLLLAAWLRGSARRAAASDSPPLEDARELEAELRTRLEAELGAD